MVTGVIQDITSKEVNTKYGPKPVYQLVINGQSYDYGFKQPAAQIGDTVSFEVQGKYQNINPETFRMGGAAVAQQAVQTGQAHEGFDRNRSIVRQNALSHATRLIASGYQGESAEKAAEQIIAIAREFERYSMLEDEA